MVASAGALATATALAFSIGWPVVGAAGGSDPLGAGVAGGLAVAIVVLGGGAAPGAVVGAGVDAGIGAGATVEIGVVAGEGPRPRVGTRV